jgi:hypothetical protein
MFLAKLDIHMQKIKTRFHLIQNGSKALNKTWNLCLHVYLGGVSTCLHPLDEEKIALSGFSVCFQHQRVINCNNLGALSGILHSIWEGGPSPFPRRCVLLPDCSGPEVWPRTTFWVCEWIRTAEFLDNVVKRALKTGTTATMKKVSSTWLFCSPAPAWRLCANQDLERK